jgi:hypothetical protein
MNSTPWWILAALGSSLVIIPDPATTATGLLLLGSLVAYKAID